MQRPFGRFFHFLPDFVLFDQLGYLFFVPRSPRFTLGVRFLFPLVLFELSFRFPRFQIGFPPIPYLLFPFEIRRRAHNIGNQIPAEFNRLLFFFGKNGGTLFPRFLLFRALSPLFRRFPLVGMFQLRHRLRHLFKADLMIFSVYFREFFIVPLLLQIEFLQTFFRLIQFFFRLFIQFLIELFGFFLSDLFRFRQLFLFIPDISFRYRNFYPRFIIPGTRFIVNFFILGLFFFERFQTLTQFPSFFLIFRAERAQIQIFPFDFNQFPLGHKVH